MEALRAENVKKTYGNHVALAGVNLSIPKQTIFGLLGPNGAGKTTLIRIINQIIEADTGDIFINGEKLNPKHISRIGYMPEERGLYKKMKVGEQLVYLAQLRGMSRKEAVIRSKQWTKKLEIFEWWNKKIEDLSKGMAQKIQFISTILHEPELVILDEPFSGFDPINANLIKDEIFELKKNGSTIIFSTHRMESVEELCDHIALINKANVILEGKKSDIKRQFSTNTFQVQFKGDLNGLAEKYRMLDSKHIEEGYNQSLIKLEQQQSPNELLQALIQQVEVYSFLEKIPTINEIFISQVREGGSNE
ncbi:MAG: ABC transporter ATP-binding protein [Candidatus Cyclobacteriaceae bacterium M2_1C_046]